MSRHKKENLYDLGVWCDMQVSEAYENKVKGRPNWAIPEKHKRALRYSVALERNYNRLARMNFDRQPAEDGWDKE